MIKRIGIGILVFTLGLITSILIESELRQLIQTLFKTLTNNAIHFYGKDFHLFASAYYYISFGLLFLISWTSWTNFTTRQKILNGLLTMVIFLLSITVVSWLDSNRKIVECTACDDGRRGIHYNDINYDGIIVVSLIISIVPTGLRLLRRRPPAHNKKFMPAAGDV
jgi:hypothetical protein